MQYIGFALFGAGDVIFKQGDTGEHFYIILSGAVDVSVYTDEETKVRHLRFCLPLYEHNMFVACIYKLCQAVSVLSFVDMSSSAMCSADCAETALILQEEKVVAHLLAGASFGELALMQVGTQYISYLKLLLLHVMLKLAIVSLLT